LRDFGNYFPRFFGRYFAPSAVTIQPLNRECPTDGCGNDFAANELKELVHMVAQRAYRANVHSSLQAEFSPNWVII